MIFSKNLTNSSMLEAELKQLKLVYRKALEAKNIASVEALRKKIKLLQARWYIMFDSTISVHAGPDKT